MVDFREIVRSVNEIFRFNSAEVKEEEVSENQVQESNGYVIIHREIPIEALGGKFLPVWIWYLGVGTDDGEDHLVVLKNSEGFKIYADALYADAKIRYVGTDDVLTKAVGLFFPNVRGSITLGNCGLNIEYRWE